MQIDILTVLPGLLQGPFDHSILKRAREKNLLTVNLHDLREFTPYKHGQVDDYQFGGGAGMVMMPEPLALAIEKLSEQTTYNAIIFMTPDGEQLNQKIANSFSLATNLMIICGHYKGIDDRIRQHFVTREISVGDYVLSGGELAAAILVDAIGRLIPGVLNDETSALFDSFQDDLLAPPVYTRPADFRGWKVPDELISGDPKIVDEWRLQQSITRTRERRPDMFREE